MLCYENINAKKIKIKKNIKTIKESNFLFVQIQEINLKYFFSFLQY